jgi:hypothetical protein
MVMMITGLLCVDARRKECRPFRSAPPCTLHCIFPAVAHWCPLISMLSGGVGGPGRDETPTLARLQRVALHRNSFTPTTSNWVDVKNDGSSRGQ